MAGKRCRDCSVCTRSAVQSLGMFIPRVVYALAFSWNYGGVKKHCPDCGHFLSQHRKRADGSFID